MHKLKKIFLAKGAERILLKKLSPNDNSKNQVYLGGDFESLNIIPNKGVYVDKGRKGSKRDRFKADVSMFWVNSNGDLYKAPLAQLILYPKYPEVRMSGFLQGCDAAPSHTMASRNEGRLLFIGIRGDGSIICHATNLENELTAQIQRIRNLEKVGVFLEIPLPSKIPADTRSVLLDTLRHINQKGWINSVRLCADGSLTECKSSNCGGYTLEAQLGIKPNGYSEPDFLGWEVKQHSVKYLNRPHSGGPITLMTPEPTGGFYKDKGVESFLRKFGYKDRKGREDRINFGGAYKLGQAVDLTGMTLHMPGYDVVTGKITDADGGLTLVSAEGEQAAIWHYADIMKLWNRKHSKAVYVPSLCETAPSRRYKFGNIVELGTGTDFLKFLNAVAKGKVYYDPGIKLEDASAIKARTKRRSQFRIKPSELKSLYNQFETVDTAIER
ncbi:MAG: MvaI/BcnI restriction endonuclease family protein [Alphaproteobacteria bacterium]|nr:MvaI/BcnI restriction endonuclease family protein [Alphaproteobacteria bacterium]